MSLPRVLFVSRERHLLPLPPAQRRKWEAIGERLDYRVLAAAQPGSPTRAERFRLAPPFRLRLLDGPLFYLALPYRVALELRRFRPDVVIAQNVHETVLVLAARAMTGSGVRVVLDLHGDWRATTRLYGGALRRTLNPINDVLGPLAVRRADAVRTISGWTAGLVRECGVEPAAVFPAFVDVAAFRERPPQPLPERPRALFVGVLERYKGFDVLTRAWREVAGRLPAAQLHVVGRGTLAPDAARLRAELPERVLWDEQLTPPEVAAAIDAATLLVLPSRAEGLGRVVIEAFCRARPVVGARAGGIPDVVVDGETGVLVAPGDASELAGALGRLLADRGLAGRMGDAGAEEAERWAVTADVYADRVATLVRGLLPNDDDH
jgi:glycosyltransferase involved in cell wall biosynthesis